MNRYTLEYLLRLISEPVPFGVINSPQVQSIRPKKATGILVGGNISLIVDSLNTPYEIDTKDKILFLEDVGEDFKVISNYFLALKKKKKFDKVKGVIFGKMVDCFEHAGKFHSMKDVLSDMFSDFDFPIIFRFPSGHAKEKNEFRVTLPLGVSVTINAQEAALTIDQAAVC
jgi:muramoyltetrapeptide carboxypeptidase